VRLSWHGGPRGLPSLPLAAALVVAAAVSLYSCLRVIEAVLTGYAFDWENFIQAAARLGQGTLYEVDYPYAFRWSPMAAWILGLVTLLPLWAWQVLHVAVLPLLRTWWLVVACLVSYPFWFDIQTGNIMIFVAVTAVWAARGNGPATALFLVLTVLVPRPLMLPAAAWLLWHRPGWRLPFAALFAVHAGAVVASGYTADWLTALIGVERELANDFNFGPSSVIGVAWIPIGAALAVWLTWRGRLGLASMAASPYWLPYYFLMVLVEFSATAVPSTTGALSGRRHRGITATSMDSEFTQIAGSASMAATGTIAGRLRQAPITTSPAAAANLGRTGISRTDGRVVSTLPASIRNQRIQRSGSRTKVITTIAAVTARAVANWRHSRRKANHSRPTPGVTLVRRAHAHEAG